MDGGFVSQSREQIHRDLFWTNQKLFFFFFQYDIWARYLQRRISEEYYEIFIYSCILIFFFFSFYTLLLMNTRVYTDITDAERRKSFFRAILETGFE